MSSVRRAALDSTSVTKAFVDTGRMLLVGDIATGGMARCTCVQVVAAFDGYLRMSSQANSRGTMCRAAIVPARRPYSIGEPATRGAILFVDGESRAGRQLGYACDGHGGAEQWADAARGVVADTFARRVASGVPSRVADALVAGVRRARPSQTDVHADVLNLLRAVENDLTARLHLSTLLARATLPPDRLSRIFTEQVGIPFRAYVAWQRLRRAASVLGEGAALSAAANAAGFTSAGALRRLVSDWFYLDVAADEISWSAMPRTMEGDE